MGARRVRRQGLRARQRPLGHLRPRLPRLPRDGEEPARTWEQVFLPARIERLKKLLDDLQSRLNAGGVAVVRAQLDAWCAGVQARLSTGEVPSEQLVRDGVRRQTVIWRQLLAGDKEPDAYLDRHARAGLRDDLRRLIWRRYRRWSVVLAAALFVLVLALPHLISAYETGFVQTGLASRWRRRRRGSASPRCRSC